MCFDGATYCVKVKDIDKKLNCGYTLGPCGSQQPAVCDNSISSTQFADSCECSGKLNSMVIKYVGPDGMDINVSSKKCSVPITSVLGANTGDEFTVNASDGGLSYLKNHTYFDVPGLGKVRIPSSCKCNSQGQRYFPFEIVAWTDTDGNSCEVVPPCEDLSVTVTLDIFSSETSVELENVSTGTILLDNPPGTYTPNGSQTVVHDLGCQSTEDCYELRVGDTFGDGLCCFWGAGGYSITLGGTVVGSPTGGAFGFSETVEIGDCNNQVLRLAVDEEQIISDDITTALASLSAYPNPLENTASFDFILPETDNATLEVVNIKGDKIGVLYSGIAEGGESHKVTFDATELPSGIYFVQLITSTEFIKEKIVIIK